MGLAGGLNAYAYVDGNPIGYVDPLGLFKQDRTGFENSSVDNPELHIPDIYSSNPKRDKQVEKLRNGEDITVNSVEEARDILDHIPELKPSGGGNYIPGDIDPPGTYRGDLINKNDPTSPQIHPRGPHMHTPHFNLTLRLYTDKGLSRRRKSAIFIEGK